MRRVPVICLATAFIVLALSGMFSCMGTPTLPAPPPVADQFYALEAPDVDGYVTIEGMAGAFPTWDMEADRVYGLVINLNTHQGVMEPVNMDGSFLGRIQAESGHEITVSTRYSDGTESMPIKWVVPFP